MFFCDDKLILPESYVFYCLVAQLWYRTVIILVLLMLTISCRILVLFMLQGRYEPTFRLHGIQWIKGWTVADHHVWQGPQGARIGMGLGASFQMLPTAQCRWNPCLASLTTHPNAQFYFVVTETSLLKKRRRKDMAYYGVVKMVALL